MPAKKILKTQPLRGSLSEQAYQTVRRMILRGELPPGAAIARRPLAKQLGMSFLPCSVWNTTVFSRAGHELARAGGCPPSTTCAATT